MTSPTIEELRLDLNGLAYCSDLNAYEGHSSAESLAVSERRFRALSDALSELERLRGFAEWVVNSQDVPCGHRECIDRAADALGVDHAALSARGEEGAK